VDVINYTTKYKLTCWRLCHISLIYYKKLIWW